MPLSKIIQILIENDQHVIYENLVNINKLEERFGKTNTMDEVQKYIDTLNQMIKEGKEPPIILSLNPNKN